MAEPRESWGSGRIDGRAGPAMLLFGRMYEDPAVEAAVVPSGAPVFCVASAGCTALALAARGHAVTAVDINPAQAAYVAARRDGAPPRLGQVDRMIGLARRRLRLLGGEEAALREFLLLDAPALQAERWRHAAAERWRAAVAEVLAAIGARASGAPGVTVDMLLRRLERGLAHHPNRTNPFAWRLLLGAEPPGTARLPGPCAGPLAVAAADAVQFLEESPPGRFGAFCLSNLEDVLPAAEVGRLRRAAARAARPGAVLVMRSLGEPRTLEEARWALRDRAMIWGRIEVSVLP